jgi:signal transduction histidine kinase
MKINLKPIDWKLKNKVILHIFVIGLISAVLLTTLFMNVEKARINTFTSQKTELIGAMISCNVSHQMIKGDTEAIGINLERMALASSLLHLRILDLEGKILNSSQKQEIGGSVPASDRAALKSLYSNPDPTDLFSIKPVIRTQSYLALENLPECQRCHAAENFFNGILEVHLDDSLELSLMQRNRFLGILIALSTLLVLTFIIFRLYERVINRPLMQLKKTMSQVRDGDLSLQVTTRKKDEFGELAHSFNTMVSRLNDAQQKIADLHDREMEKAGHLASLGELAAGLAHEIKNPIAGIKGSLEIIRDRTAPDAPEREIFSEILIQTEKIYVIIQDLLDYAKPKALTMHPVDPNTCLQDAIHLSGPQTQNKDIRFHFTGLDKDLLVTCDPEKLKGVMLNLMINSIAAIEQQGDITVELDLKANDTLTIRISDTGKGIKPEHLDKIFHPFFTTRKHGTGLGLSICKQVVEAHHGQISVTSTESKGTTFTIELPLEQGRREPS